MIQKIGFFLKNYSRFLSFPKYHMKILLGDFNAKVGRANIFKPTSGNGSLHQDSNDNGIRIVNYATSKNPVVKRAQCCSNETFISATGPLLMGTFTTRLVTY